MLLNKDCFSSGQITSKLWLCKKLEDLNWESDNTAIYGGWQGMLAFLLLSRGKFKVKKIRSLYNYPTKFYIVEVSANIS